MPEDFLRSEVDQQLTGFIQYLREQYMLVNKYMVRLGQTFNQRDESYNNVVGNSDRKYPMLSEYSSLRTLNREIKFALEDAISLQLKLVRNSEHSSYKLEKGDLVEPND